MSTGNLTAKRIARFSLGLVAGVIACGPLWAEDDATGNELPGMVVTGTRLADAPQDQPYAFYRVTGEALDTRIGRTALDRLNYGPGVFVQRTAPNQGSPFIRGLTGEQTLLLLDGVRFSHAMMRPGPNQYAALIPGVSIYSIDAILGASSTVNGSDGLTGGLDYRLDPAGRGIDSAASPWIETRVDTGNGGTVELGVDGTVNDWAYSVELSGSMFHDRIGGKDFEDHIVSSRNEDNIPNTAYDEYATGLRLAYTGLERHLLELSAGHARQLDAPRPGGYAENSGKSSRLYRYFDPQAFSYLHLRDRWDVGGDVVEHLQTTVWWHQFAEEQFRSSIRDSGTPTQRLRRREYDDTLNAYGADVQATTLLGAEEQHSLTWGGTLVYETTANSYREYRTPAGSLDPAQYSAYKSANWPNNTSVSDDSSYTTFGLFAQDNWQVTPRVSLLTGARYSQVNWSFGDVDGDADDVTGSLRALLELTPYQRVFAGASKGFRAPNLNNLDGVVDRGSSGQEAQGNPDLDPEISYTYETGWKWNQGANSVAVTAFITDIDELIQPDYSVDGEVANVEGAEIQGVESAWDYGINWDDTRRLALVGSVSLVEATRDIPLAGGGSFEDNLSRANRLYGRLGLEYKHSRNWWGLTQLRWHDDYDKVAEHPSDADADDIRLTIAGDPDGSMPAYGVVDIMAGWQSDDGNRHVSVFVENIAAETYREPGSGVDGVGRSVGVTAGVRL